MAERSRPDDAVRHHDALARSWAAGYRRGGFRRRLEAFRASLDAVVRPGQRWLDLGCGAGVLTIELARRGARVIALDGSSTMIEAAAAEFARAGFGAERLVRGEIHDLGGIGDRSLDGVLCSSVLEYSAEPARVLTEIARVLVPGGIAIVSVPPRGSVVRSLQRLARAAGAWFGRDPFPYLATSRTELDREEMAALATRAGLALGASRGFDPVLRGLAGGPLRPSLVIHELRRPA